MGRQPRTVSLESWGARASAAWLNCSNGALSQEAITAIIVVFSLLAAVLLAVGLVLLLRKLREKRQTQGTYRPSSEEQVGARVPPPPNLKLPPEERLI